MKQDNHERRPMTNGQKAGLKIACLTTVAISECIAWGTYAPVMNGDMKQACVFAIFFTVVGGLIAIGVSSE